MDVLVVNGIAVGMPVFASNGVFLTERSVLATPSLGELEHLVLLVIVRLGDEAYGMRISEELAVRTGRLVRTVDRPTRHPGGRRIRRRSTPHRLHV